MIKKLFPEKILKTLKNFLIHIHGGAFIASSSNYHQSYSRQLTKKLGIPIFSIDYGLAPQSPFPRGIEDCFSSVSFLLQFLQNFLKIEISSYFLMGDSSGGNFAFSTLQWLIESGLPKPKKVLLIYPVGYLRCFDFTPSILLSLNETLLTHSLTQLVYSLYL